MHTSLPIHFQVVPRTEKSPLPPFPPSLRDSSASRKIALNHERDSLFVTIASSPTRLSPSLKRFGISRGGIILAFINYARFARNNFNFQPLTRFQEMFKAVLDPARGWRIQMATPSTLTDHFPFLRSFFSRANPSFRNHLPNLASLVFAPEVNGLLCITYLSLRSIDRWSVRDR